MKRITEEELNNEYLLKNPSRAAWVTFGAGLVGSLLCVVVFYMTDQFLGDIRKIINDANERRFELTVDEQMKIREEIDNRTIQFFRFGVPLFLSANILWILGGFSWSIDLKRDPSNKFIWKLGGILVLVTAVACGIAWFLLIRLNLNSE